MGGFNRKDSPPRRPLILKRVSILAYLVMVGVLVVLLISGKVFSGSPGVILAQILAGSLFIWARFTLGRRSYHVAADPTAGGIVTRGPYRFIRHPIYTAFCLFLLPGIFAHWTWWTGLCGGLVLGSAAVRMACEERLLLLRYPEYQRYAETTWRMIYFVF